MAACKSQSNSHHYTAGGSAMFTAMMESLNKCDILRNDIRFSAFARLKPIDHKLSEKAYF